MDIVVELVVKDIQKAAEFYTKYLGFAIDFTEYDPVSWMQLSNGEAKIMLVTYDFTKNDIAGFKEFSPSTNLYKFRYDSLDEVKQIRQKLLDDKKHIFLDLRKVDYGFEMGVFDEDANMILVSNNFM